MIKVRFKTWYWGNYCWAGKNEKIPEGFELYDEEKHGWKNSEEFKLNGKPQYDNGEPEGKLKTFINSGYYQNGSWKC